MNRPNCLRCSGPLDPFVDEEIGIQWVCNNTNISSGMTDTQFEKYISLCTGDEIAQLEKLIDLMEMRKRGVI